MVPSIMQFHQYTVPEFAKKDRIPFNVCGCLKGTIDIKGDRIDKLNFHSFFLNVLDVQRKKSPKPKKWSHANNRATSELALAQRWSSRRLAAAMTTFPQMDLACRKGSISLVSLNERIFYLVGEDVVIKLPASDTTLTLNRSA